MGKYKNFVGLGIAGNFALHLEQAGELEEFKNIVTAEEVAPKGIFPFYLPKQRATAEKQRYLTANKMLSTYPISSNSLLLPKEDVNIQAEPEVAIICRLEYQNGMVSNIEPTHFTAYNDCSIRVEGASKISDKKNWGADSKGLSNDLIAIDKFKSGGIMDSYSIASFLKRDEEVHAYGEDVELTGYSYFHDKLLNWIKNKLVTQEDFGPLEPISEYLTICANPDEAIVSIGATRYTEYGEKTFLKTHDEVIVVVYNSDKFSSQEIAQMAKENSLGNEEMSVLIQKVL
ncbi:MAG: DUF5718 family protein [Campylobacterota bacterium]|nr:DUF5718 family protein [Campylobacterota bacterium]